MQTYTPTWGLHRWGRLSVCMAELVSFREMLAITTSAAFVLGAKNSLCAAKHLLLGLGRMCGVLPGFRAVWPSATPWGAVKVCLFTHLHGVQPAKLGES